MILRIKYFTAPRKTLRKALTRRSERDWKIISSQTKPVFTLTLKNASAARVSRKCIFDAELSGWFYRETVS